MLLGIDISPAVRGYKTGTEWYTIHLICALQKIIPPDVRVILYTPRTLNGMLGAVPSHWEVKVLSWPIKHGWAFVRLAFELMVHTPDVFFSPACAIPSLVAWWARRHTMKIITTLHDNAFDIVPFVYSRRQRRHLHRITRRAMHCAQQIIVPSQMVRRDLLSTYTGHHVDIKVIPHGVDETFFLVSAEDIHRVCLTYHLPKRYCIVVGRWERKKQTLEIVRIFSKLMTQQHIPADVGLVLVGTPGYGWDARAYERARAQAPDRFVMIYHATQTDIPAFIAGADALILWSVYEGFGMPATEAMAVGTPVMVSTGGALPEVVGDAGVIIPLHESAMLAKAICDVCQEPALMTHYRTCGYHRVAGMRWHDTAQKTWDVIAHMKQV